MRRAIVATAFLIASTPAHADEVRLDDDQIIAALSDQTAIYTDGEVYQYFDPNGQTPYWDRGRLTRGSWTVNGGRYCSTWPPSTGVSCYEVFSNDADEIIWIGARGDRYVATMVDGNKLP